MKETQEDLKFIEEIKVEYAEITDINYGSSSERSTAVRNLLSDDVSKKIKEIVTKIMNDSDLKIQMMNNLVASNFISEDTRKVIEEKQSFDAQATALVEIFEGYHEAPPEQFQALNSFIFLVNRITGCKFEIERTIPIISNVMNNANAGTQQIMMNNLVANNFIDEDTRKIIEEKQPLDIRAAALIEIVKNKLLDYLSEPNFFSTLAILNMLIIQSAFGHTFNLSTTTATSATSDPTQSKKMEKEEEQDLFLPQAQKKIPSKKAKKKKSKKNKIHQEENTTLLQGNQETEQPKEEVVEKNNPSEKKLLELEQKTRELEQSNLYLEEQLSSTLKQNENKDKRMKEKLDNLQDEHEKEKEKDKLLRKNQQMKQQEEQLKREIEQLKKEVAAKEDPNKPTSALNQSIQEITKKMQDKTYVSFENRYDKLLNNSAFSDETKKELETATYSLRCPISQELPEYPVSIPSAERGVNASTVFDYLFLEKLKKNNKGYLTHPISRELFRMSDVRFEKIRRNQIDGLLSQYEELVTKIETQSRESANQNSSQFFSVPAANSDSTTENLSTSISQPHL